MAYNQFSCHSIKAHLTDIMARIVTWQIIPLSTNITAIFPMSWYHLGAIFVSSRITWLRWKPICVGWLNATHCIKLVSSKTVGHPIETNKCCVHVDRFHGLINVLIISLACWHRQVSTTCATIISCSTPIIGSSPANIVRMTIEVVRIA